MASQTLTNDFMGPSYTLQSDPQPRYRGALQLAPTSEKEPGLIWTITAAPERPGRYRISITNSEGRFKNLDLYNDGSGDKTRVCLAEPGFYSGQFWTLIPYDDEEGVNGKGEGVGRWFKLSNEWTGSGWFLDRRRSGTCEAFMSQGDCSGQRWWITVPEVLESATKVSLPKAIKDQCYDEEALQHLERKQKSYVAMSLIGAAAVGFFFGRMWDLLF